MYQLSRYIKEGLNSTNKNKDNQHMTIYTQHNTRRNVLLLVTQLQLIMVIGELALDMLMRAGLWGAGWFK